MTRRLLAGLFAFLLVPLVVTRGAEAQPAPPQLTAPVNDFANVIDAASEAELDRRIRALQAASGDVVAVATVPTFKPYADIREYGVKMFENGGRGIGQKGKDNGLLIVVAVEDRRVDIEVGYDLEEFITDGFAGETIREGMTPEFRAGGYGGGLVEGTTRIINRIAQRRGVTLQDVPRTAQPTPVKGRSRFPWILLLVILIGVYAASGGKAEMRVFRFDGLALTAGVDGFTLRGKEPAGAKPLFHAKSVEVELRILSFFKRSVDLQSVRIVAPV